MPTEEIKRTILEEIRPHFGSFRDEDAMLDFLYTLTQLKPELFRFKSGGPPYPTARTFVLPEFKKYNDAKETDQA
ncbi:MAG: hypothetical protein K0Q91_410 [Fibrobacteria bacterium]|jgi:hypothetical protein|nr:hypothetical protein [Fibrobacteria bacterium]